MEMFIHEAKVVKYLSRQSLNHHATSELCSQNMNEIVY